MSDADPTWRDGTLARFVDAHTVRFERVYRAAPERVWRAVTDADALNVWFHPVSEVEPRAGGRCRFSWGAPEAKLEGRVARFEPPRAVRYAFPNDSHLAFELQPAEGGTALAFSQYFGPAWVDPDPDAFADREGEKDAGPMPPWRAGILAGFHGNLAVLSEFLTDAWPPERVRAESRRCAEGTRAGAYTPAVFETQVDWDGLVDAYHTRILTTHPQFADARR